ncbi:uncharacterized protein [Nicotiana tomentosiformis]|uniref:uncharacterized protein n=1 Tax=Nicotiana tomentosiformis TaxID=4098 RepID=UPI00388C3924
MEAKCDSLLMVNQVNETFEVWEDRMQRYLDKLQVTLHRFKEWILQHVLREQNSEADALGNLGSSDDDDELNSGTVVQLMKSVIEEDHAEINSTSLTWDWRNKYIEYFKNGKLPSDPQESRTLCTKAARFTLSNDGALFRRTFDGPLAICLGTGDTDYILREIHEGTYGNHSGDDSLVHKIIRAGYYWIAQAFEKVREKEVIDFIWDHIICRFGMPSDIVCDNGKQFIESKVTKFLEDHKIKRILSTSYHPSRNREDESTNKTIIQNLKKRLTNAKGKWR